MITYLIVKLCVWIITVCLKLLIFPIKVVWYIMTLPFRILFDACK